MTDTNRLHTDIEQSLAGSNPDVELLSCERVGGDRLRLFIDHPDGVSLELCEHVTRSLQDLLHSHSLEVSSPGPQRPLVKPEHFRRFLGCRAKVRTKGRSADRSSTGRAPDPALGAHRNVVGELVGATDEEVTVAIDDGATEAGVVSIPYTEISRSNLLERRGEEKR